MGTSTIARVSVTIEAPISRVWEALVTPASIKRYMFGATVVSDWQEGSPIVWKGEWKGKAYEDKGTILRLEPPRILSYTHYSPLAGKPDVPENYQHTVVVELAEQGKRTLVTLSQDNNPTEEAREHSEKNWQTMLDGLKKLLEA